MGAHGMILVLLAFAGSALATYIGWILVQSWRLHRAETTFGRLLMKHAAQNTAHDFLQKLDAAFQPKGANASSHPAPSAMHSAEGIELDAQEIPKLVATVEILVTLFELEGADSKHLSLVLPPLKQPSDSGRA